MYHLSASCPVNRMLVTGASTVTICMVAELDVSTGGVKYSVPWSVDNSILRPAAALFRVTENGHDRPDAEIATGVVLVKVPLVWLFMVVPFLLVEGGKRRRWEIYAARYESRSLSDNLDSAAS